MDKELYEKLKERYGSVIADELMQKYDITPKPYQVPTMPQKYRNRSSAPIPLRKEIYGAEVDKIEQGGYIEAVYAQEAREEGMIVLGARRIWPRDDYKRDSERTTDGYYAKGVSGYMVTTLDDWDAIADRPPPSASTAPGLR